LSNDTVKDPIAVGLGSLAGGVGFGAACMTTAQIFVALNEDRYDLSSSVLVGGLLTAVGIGGMCGWYRSYALANVWQQGVIAVLAAIGALLIGFLAAPIYKFSGVWGMIVWLLLNIAFGILATRWAIRGKEQEGPGTGAA
jgi:hypothetical protein